jgi:hypothetical protein
MAAVYTVENLVNDIFNSRAVGDNLKEDIKTKFKEFKDNNNLTPEQVFDSLGLYKTTISSDPTKQTKFLNFFQKIYGEFLPLLSPSSFADIRLDDFKRQILFVDIFPSPSSGGGRDLGDPTKGSLVDVGRRTMEAWQGAAAARIGIGLGTVDPKQLNLFETPMEKYLAGVTNEADDIKNKKNAQKFLKPANYKTSNVNHDTKDISIMQKKADKFSKQYYQDAISGLDDTYAKSYYAGLKSMYDKKPKKTKADYVKLYELHDETGPELIGSAHPKSIGVADAMGNGGLLENQIEQQRANIGVARSMPSGNFLGRHAWVLHNLVKLAESADEAGDLETSDLIDAAIEKLNKL